MTAVPCFAADPATRARLVAEARRWLGTPYCHQASCRGAGADCLGLIRGIWRAVYGAEPEVPPAYAPDWGETDGRETLLAAASRHLRPIPIGEAGLGDVLVFRMRARGPAKHLALLATPWIEGGRIIHAYSGQAVCETHLGSAWLRRCAGTFRYPAAHLRSDDNRPIGRD
ncbi:MAG: peptidase P60 [Paracoccaceae bacterium]